MWSDGTAMQWNIGGLQVELRGHGGREGGELSIGGDDTVGCYKKRLGSADV